jgi:hypothetical protein
MRKTGSCQVSQRVYPFSSTAIIHVSIPVDETNNTKVSRYAVAKSYFVSLNNVTFVFNPIHQHV